MNKPVDDDFVLKKYAELEPFEEWESDNIICYKRFDTLLVAEHLEFKEWVFTLFDIEPRNRYIYDRHIHKNRPRDRKSKEMLEKLNWREDENLSTAT